jgi:hypothetical protein
VNILSTCGSLNSVRESEMLSTLIGKQYGHRRRVNVPAPHSVCNNEGHLAVIHNVVLIWRPLSVSRRAALTGRHLASHQKVKCAVHEWLAIRFLFSECMKELFTAAPSELEGRKLYRKIMLLHI